MLLITLSPLLSLKFPPPFQQPNLPTQIPSFPFPHNHRRRTEKGGGENKGDSDGRR